jgi:hypothetical protein
MDSPELFWEQLLSRQPEQILAVYTRLSPDEQENVLSHLERMATEPGWHPEQRLSAQAALLAILDEGREAGQ